MQLVKKPEGLVSKHEAGKLRRQIFIQDRVKNMNESIYYSVDTLNEAITEGKKISFRYFDYNVRKEQVLRRDGGRYVASPAALSWSDEHYYLISFLDGRDGISHFRVDRMSSVRLLNEPRCEDAENFKKKK
jgi:predicted DNA-binding transcriptional regulator YafY